jgi:hypothetical protein
MFHPLAIRDCVHVAECKDCQEHLALSAKTAQQLYDEFRTINPTIATNWKSFKPEDDLPFETLPEAK